MSLVQFERLLSIMIEVVVLLAPQKSFSWTHLVQQKPKITTMVYRLMGAQWSFSWSVQVSQHSQPRRPGNHFRSNCWLRYHSVMFHLVWEDSASKLTCCQYMFLLFSIAGMSKTCNSWCYQLWTKPTFSRGFSPASFFKWLDIGEERSGIRRCLVVLVLP